MTTVPEPIWSENTLRPGKELPILAAVCYNILDRNKPGGFPLSIAGIVLGILLLDQFSKYLVQMFLSPGETVPLIHNIFHLTYVQNPGAAFGILAHRIYFFIVTAFLVIFFILIFFAG